jgi:hypothetical protein
MRIVDTGYPARLTWSKRRPGSAAAAVWRVRVKGKWRTETKNKHKLNATYKQEKEDHYVAVQEHCYCRGSTVPVAECPICRKLWTHERQRTGPSRADGPLRISAAAVRLYTEDGDTGDDYDNGRMTDAETRLNERGEIGSELHSEEMLKGTFIWGSAAAHPTGLALSIDGKRREYGLNLAFAGSSNAAYYLHEAGPSGPMLEDVLIRVAHAPEDDDDDALRERAEEFQRESAFARRIGEEGIGPAIYAELEIDGRLGFAMERFDHSLDEVARCPALMKTMFVESDGESALVDLYVQSSRLLRCVDTKPGNVVVRLERSDAELAWRKPGRGAPRLRAESRSQHSARTRRMLPRIALIDVDAAFCGEVKQVGSQDPAYGEDSDLTVSLDETLQKTSAADILNLSRDHPVDTPRNVLAAVMSLLIHCTVAAFPKRAPFGFPYPRIARVLLRNWRVVSALVEVDASSHPRYRMTDDGHDRWTVKTMLREYYKAAQPFHLDLIRDRLTAAVGSAATRALELCTEPATSVGPELYEYAALVMQGADYEPGPTQATLLDRARLAHSDQEARCHRRMCPDHLGGPIIEPADLTDLTDRAEIDRPRRKRIVKTPVRSKRHRPFSAV